MVTIPTFLWLVGCFSQNDATDIAQYLGNWKRFDKELASLQLSIEESDLLLLDLAVRYPDQAMPLCKRVATENAKEKCQQVIGRPHLQQKRPQK